MFGIFFICALIFFIENAVAMDVPQLQNLTQLTQIDAHGKIFFSDSPAESTTSETSDTVSEKKSDTDSEVDATQATQDAATQSVQDSQLVEAVATIATLKKEIDTLKQLTEPKQTPPCAPTNSSTTTTQPEPASHQEMLAAGGEASMKTEISCCSCGKFKTECRCKAAAKYGMVGAAGVGIGAGLNEVGLISCCSIM